MIRDAWLYFILALSMALGKPMYELPPISYGEGMAKGRVEKLIAEMEERGDEMPGRSSLEFLRWLLAELEVPEASQLLVFSKTSLQVHLISPQNPRALYFSDDIYVGWVPGGIVELAVSDPELGMVFYEVDYRKRMPSQAFIRSNECLTCHASSRTEGVPGAFVRSVFPDRDGQPMGQFGGFLSNDATEMAHRWGGYYLTGVGPGVLHMGNQIYDERIEPKPKDIWHESLEDVIDVDRYLQPTSDIKPMMMLEHQTRVHNVLIRAAMRYRRALHFAQLMNEAPAASESVRKTLASEVEKVLEVMLFRDEAPITGDGMAGDQKIADILTATAPVSSEGRSLKQTRLYPRLMKYRLSYMIYSEAFASLPDALRNAVLARLKEGLTSEDKLPMFDHLGPKERRRIDHILTETYAGW